MQKPLAALPIYSRPTQAARLLGIGESTFWARAKSDPSFPKLVKLGARTTVVKTAELLAWAESRSTETAA